MALCHRASVRHVTAVMRVVTRAAHMPAREQVAVLGVERDLHIVPIGGESTSISTPLAEVAGVLSRLMAPTGYEEVSTAESALFLPR